MFKFLSRIADEVGMKHIFGVIVLLGAMVYGPVEAIIMACLLMYIFGVVQELLNSEDEGGQ